MMARRASALLLGVALLVLAPISHAQTSEQAVKAAFLYRFASFVTWPQSVYASDQAPITLCVLDDGPFASDLERVVSGQHVEQHPFVVRRLANLASARQCQVLYAAGAESNDAVRSVRGAPVLTVTDGVGDAQSDRGVLHFVVIDNRVRFYADDAQAAQNNLSISSRLLALAVSVRRRGS